MPLHLYRSNRTEELVRKLTGNLARTGPADPFVEQPIVVGSRGMERWLRNQIATHLGIATRLAFPFPGPALDGGVTALLGLDDATLPFWAREQSEGTWRTTTLPWRVLMVLRGLLSEFNETSETDAAHEAVMSRVARYLHPNEQAVPRSTDTTVIGAREQTFATEVAGAIDEILRMRPDTAQQWLREDDENPPTDDERWLALVLRRLVVEDAPGNDAEHDASGVTHPAWRRRQLAERLAKGGNAKGLAAQQKTTERPPLHIFGLSTLPAEELKTLALISGPAGLDVHLYLLAPSRAWFGDMPTREETRSQLRRLGRELDVSSASADTRYKRQCEIIEKEEQKNRILADLGRPSRDVQALLELHADHYQEVEGDSGDDLFVEHAAQCNGQPTLLSGLQDGLLEATSDSEGSRSRIDSSDNSLLFLPCHGPLRQVEELRYRLLDAFSQDRTLQPRDVLVMTPDIATFAPLVAAVFAEEGKGQVRSDDGEDQVTRLPAIPVDISDLGLRSTNRVADVLLSLLKLATERITLPALLNLLQVAPLRERFGLSGDDYADLQRILLESGVRWGIDADDRAQAGQPELQQNTLSFGLERVALGALFLDETDLMDAGTLPLEVHASPEAGPGAPQLPDGSPDPHFAPFDALDSESVSRFGRLYGCIGAVVHHREAVRKPTSARGWQERLETLLNDLTTTSDESAWLSARVLQEVQDLTNAAELSVGETPIDLATIRAELHGRFDLPRTGDRPISGGVSVCAMEPMRSVPFRIVALLGMNQDAFPRQGRRRAWHPMARGRRVGEHDPRDIDRHLLLEALLSARQQCMVLWTGFDVQTGEALPEAVPIRELAETVDLRFSPPEGQEASGASCSEWLTRPGTLQPWSEKRFQADVAAADNDTHGASHLGFDLSMCEAASQLREQRAGRATPKPPKIVPGNLDGLDHDTDSVHAQSLDVTTLARALSNPAKILLSQRFGLRLVDDELELQAREALELDSLQKWQMRSHALRLALRGQQGEAAGYLAQRWRAEGTLPIGPAAVADVQIEVTKTVDLLMEALGVLGVTDREGQHLGLHPEQLSVTIDDESGGTWGLVLDEALFAVDPNNPDARVVLVPFVGTLNMTRSLVAWMTLLVAATSQPSRMVSGALLATSASGKSVMTWIEAPSDCEGELRGILRLWRQAQVAQVPLFKYTSWALAEVLMDLQVSRGDEARWSNLDPTERQRFRSAAGTSWPSSANAPGDEGDRWIAAIWGAPDFETVLPDELPREPNNADATPRDGILEDAEEVEPAWIACLRDVILPIRKAQRPYETRVVQPREQPTAGGCA